METTQNIETPNDGGNKNTNTLAFSVLSKKLSFQKLKTKNYDLNSVSSFW